jgi:hypothetical protein
MRFRRRADNKSIIIFGVRATLTLVNEQQQQDNASRTKLQQHFLVTPARAFATIAGTA